MTPIVPAYQRLEDGWNTRTRRADAGLGDGRHGKRRKWCASLPVSWVDSRDLGEAAALAFVREEARDAAWTLTGSDTRTFDEVAETLTRVLGRAIRYTAPVAGYVWHLRRRRNLSWSETVVYTVLQTAIRMGAENRIDPTLEQVLGRKPRTIADTIRDRAALWHRDDMPVYV